MKSKMGRPKLPPGEAKGTQIGVRFRTTDDRRINELVEKSGQNKADWVRNAAIAESKKPPVWVKSKWTMEDLDDKTVEFRLRMPGRKDEGLGKFLVRRNPKGYLAIEICAIASATENEVVEIRYYLLQQTADRIEAHPNLGVAKFRLLM